VVLEVFSDIFDMLNPEMRQTRRQKGPQKGESVKNALPVTLEELYNGAERKIKVTRSRTCKDCKGSGSTKPDSTKTCSTCKGHGIVIQYRQLGQGFVQQVQTYCPDCLGEGITVEDKYKCKPCNGKKVISEDKTLTVSIDKGMKDGQKITFDGEADEKPGALPGDIIFILQQQPSKSFQRDGNNLILKKKLI